MDKTDWIYLTAIVILVLVTTLGVLDKLSPEDMMEIFLLIIGAVITGAVMYRVGKLEGLEEGRGGIG